MNNMRQRGFTLAEGAVVCAVLAITASMVLPSFNGAVDRRAVQGSAAQFETDVQFARSTAEAGGRNVVISFQNDSAGSCYVVHTGAAGDCGCDAAGHPVCSGDAEPLRTVFMPQGGRVQLQSNADAMLFDGHRHTVSPAGSVTLTGTGDSALREIVNIVGRTRACWPAEPMPGYKAC
jgi:type IV fimbrial biogenesis protein FimT